MTLAVLVLGRRGRCRGRRRRLCRLKLRHLLLARLDLLVGRVELRLQRIALGRDRRQLRLGRIEARPSRPSRNPRTPSQHLPAQPRRRPTSGSTSSSPPVCMHESWAGTVSESACPGNFDIRGYACAEAGRDAGWTLAGIVAAAARAALVRMDARRVSRNSRVTLPDLAVAASRAAVIIVAPGAVVEGVRAALETRSPTANKQSRKTSAPLACRSRCRRPALAGLLVGTVGARW